MRSRGVNAKASSLQLRLVGRNVEIECRCGLVVTQPQRAAIAERCPRCARWWAR